MNAKTFAIALTVLYLSACQHSEVKDELTEALFPDCTVTYSWRLEKPRPKSAADKDVIVYNENGVSVRLELLEQGDSALIFKNGSDIGITLSEFKFFYRFEGQEVALANRGFPDSYQVPPGKTGTLRNSFQYVDSLNDKKGSVFVSFFLTRADKKPTVVQRKFQLHKYRTVSNCREISRDVAGNSFTRVE